MTSATQTLTEIAALKAIDRPSSPFYTDTPLPDGGTRRDYQGGRVERFDADGELHSTDDLPSVAHMEGPGGMMWHDHGKLNRDNGPAVINGLGEYWFRNNELHREGGPAVIQVGRKPRFFLGDKEVTEAEAMAGLPDPLPEPPLASTARTGPITVAAHARQDGSQVRSHIRNRPTR